MSREPSVTANEAAERLRHRLRQYGHTRGQTPLQDDLDAALRTERLRVVEQVVRLANHGKNDPPNDPCGSCALAVEEVLAGLTGEGR